MKNNNLEEYRAKLQTLSEKEKTLRDLYLRKIAKGEIQGPSTEFASINKTWLKFYNEEHIKAEVPHMTAYEYLKKLNENNLEGIAFDSIEGKYTYKDLFNIIDNVAASLYQMNTKSKNNVLTMLPALPHESFLLYGVDRVGAAISYLHPQSSTEDIIESINNFKCDLFFTFDYFLNPEMEKEIYEKTNLKNIININFLPIKNTDSRTISWDEFLEKGKNVKLPEIKRNPEDLLFIAKTGGSTGKPKSVLLSDNSFNIAVHQYLNSDLDYQTNDRWLRLWPLFSATAAVSNNHLPLCVGMNNIIRQFPMNINDFDKIFMAEKPEHLLLIPQLLDIMEKSELLKNEDLSYVKTSGCGGMTITSQFEERVNKFHETHNINTFLGYGWGCTENATAAAMRSNEETTSIGTVGAVQVKTIVAAFDPDDGSEKQIGEEGELCIYSDTMMIGYYNDENLTNNVIKIHADGSKWLHTGDLGTIDENGIITVKGRMTRSIFVFPMAKIYPSSIEDKIAKIAGVREVAVGSIPDLEHEGFGLPICFIVPEENSNIEEIKAKIETSLSEHIRPKNIYFKNEFPRTMGDKPDIKKLESEIIDTQMTLKKSKKAN